MKKIMLILVTVSVFIFMTACASPMESWNETMLSDDEVARRKIEALIEAINSKDEQAIKKMLSENTVNKVDDIDGQIEKLIDIFDEGIESYEDPGSSDVYRDSEDGNVRVVLEFPYLIYTIDKSYWISIKYTQTDDFDVTYEGINYIFLKETEGLGVDDYPYWPDSETEIGIELK